MFLVTSEQMRRFDKYTMETLNVPGIVLMEHAGKAVALTVLERAPQSTIVVCGKGNNGGDGWVAARWLRHKGVPGVLVVSTVHPEDLSGDAAWAATTARAMGVDWRVHQEGDELPGADVFVDALLGTGSNRPLIGVAADLVAQVNAKSRWTVAIDVPSGIDADTATVEGVAVRADVTVCMGLQKLGTAVTPGCEVAGDVRVEDIGIVLPDGELHTAELVTAADVRGWFPKRPTHSHKGTFGRVGIAVGAMQGAAVLAGLGAARIGCGLVVMGHANPLSTSVPWEMVQRRIAFDDPQRWAADCQALVLGPGLGEDVDTWRGVSLATGRPTVLDADGLRLLGDWGVPLADSAVHRSLVLTPHPKECARLLGWTVDAVQAHRIEAARHLAAQTQSVVVLKGYRTVLADATGRIRVNPTGDESLATAGTGDVLAGMIGGLLAQGVTPWDAAATAAWLHGRAGELAGQARWRTGTMASDVVDNISRAILLLFDTNPGG